MDRDAPAYPIGTISNLTGFSPRQLRYYERLGILAPARSGGRQRLFSPADVDRLLALRGLLDEGMTLSGAKAVLAGANDFPQRIKEKTVVPLLDHSALLEGLQRGNSLTSLFPVNDQQSLYQLLIRIRNDE